MTLKARAILLFLALAITVQAKNTGYGLQTPLRDHIYEVDGVQYVDTGKRNETMRLILTHNVSGQLLTKFP